MLKEAILIIAIIYDEGMVNELILKLSGGDLRSDGRANEVADKVIVNPHLLDKLVEGLDVTDDVVRARTAHALERISRTHPEMLREYIPRFLDLAKKDKVPMVKWHLAMIFGNISPSKEDIDDVLSTLFHLLNDKSAAVKSWAISGLSIIGRENMGKRREIVSEIEMLQDNGSTAVRTRARMALNVLENEGAPIPSSWFKRRK